MTLVIRRATLADAPTIVQFNMLLAQESEGKTLDPNVLGPGVAAALTDPNKGPYFVAEEEGQVLGVMQTTFEWSDWRNGWMWWLQSVYVRADARRRGVFRALFEHVQECARREPAVIGLRLYVERANQRAQETYRRLGMEATGYLVFEKYPLSGGRSHVGGAQVTGGDRECGTV
jgi:GNAT superfamily N-acetyltransferase